MVVGRGRLRREDVLDARSFVLAQLPQRPEGVAHRPRGDQQNLAVALGDRITEGPAQPEVVLRVGRLAHADRDPGLVRQAPAGYSHSFVVA